MKPPEKTTNTVIAERDSPVLLSIRFWLEVMSGANLVRALAAR
jgi:hypothetical protein